MWKWELCIGFEYRNAEMPDACMVAWDLFFYEGDINYLDLTESRNQTLWCKWYSSEECKFYVKDPKENPVIEDYASVEYWQ